MQSDDSKHRSDNEPFRVVVDADACPQQVRRIIEAKCRQHNCNLTFVTDLNHVIQPEVGEVITVDQGPDSVDMAIINQTSAGDLVITQDYGLASLALAKRARALHPSGTEYRSETIDFLLMDRHLSAKARRSGERSTRHKKRSNQNNLDFEQQLEKMLNGD